MIVHVALPIPVTKTFSYIAPDEWGPFIRKYSRVTVPFHNKTLTGFVAGIEEGTGPGLKEIVAPRDPFPLLTAPLADLVEWASRYYVAPLGVVLKYALPLNLHIERYLCVRSNAPSSAALDNMPLGKVLKTADKNVLLHYLSEGAVTLFDTLTGSDFLPADGTGTANAGGEKVLYTGDIQSRLEQYTRLISTHMEKGNNVLMLLPDYFSAGAYFYRVLSEAFRGRVFWYGSSIPLKKRMETYFRVRQDRGCIVLGNKSAVFLPVNRLSCIIVERDEEDEYRNEEGFRFNPPTVAVQRAEVEGTGLFMGSASPSIESYCHAGEKGFVFIDNKWLRDRHCEEHVHEASATSYGALLEEMTTTVKKVLERGESVAIFTPRRDYGSFIQCAECKRPFLCPQCEGVLNYHKETGRLTCSNCAGDFAFEEECRHCGGHIIRFSQIGAEYIEEHIRSALPDYPVARVSGDAGKRGRRIIQPPGSGPCILIGTQPLSKLYDVHVHALMLFGWEDMRRMAGYRSDEKMFHVLVNLLDALTPDDIFFFMDTRKKVGPAYFLDMEAFYGDELKKRKDADFPPFTRMFLIEVVKKTKEAGLPVVKKVKEALAQRGLIDRISGPLMQKRKAYRWRMILKGNSETFYRSLLDIYDIPDVHIEADPPNI
ncbi:MAG: Primosomal protein N' [Syntrophorhabdus sp. PtaU1.Bin058]|nr:MAG: Primosomal protein N' [Syntrophorhabdus sp. PtaU1.Bin058]